MGRTVPSPDQAYSAAMLDKTFNPRDAEARLYARWQDAGHFQPRGDGPAYCIMLPPPNVTGSLHIGHALDHTLQDVLIRYQRMRGARTLWQPGTDHAGIATQMVVERQLAQAGNEMSRREMGRAAFIERVWQWKAESGGMITRQMHRLGQSPDWSRALFTMDEGLSHAVRTAFVRLYRDGLIYRDKRLVNWDCQLQTAISDLETVPTEIAGKLWHLRYPLENGAGTITVATTRPETMLGDTAIAVHPEDERYRDLIGTHAILPLVGRRLPIVADDYSDPEKGSGAVKITPAHDFNDFAVGQRHGLEAINIFTPTGHLNDAVPAAFHGLERFAARKAVLEALEAEGRVVQIDDISHTVPYGDRSNTAIEPLLTDQWFCDAATLAAPALSAVRDGRTRFVPESYQKVYFNWLENIQPWCISRQLWWGHRIPAWYGPDGRIFVAMSEDEAHAAATAHFGERVVLRQDEDVLDTWFSSGIWPLSTLGWPGETAELARYYPTSVLVTGYDIIFFWVARMMMQCLYFHDEVPFKEVCIHGLVRDQHGQKMSKTKGNVVDPLQMVDDYGADALRFAICASTALGRDVRFSEARVQGYRNFVTKLWNAARFCEMNACRLAPDFALDDATLTLNRWIVSELRAATREVSNALDGYRFNDAADRLYQFTWSTFCDWFIELAKPLLSGDDAAAKEETQKVAGGVLAELLHLLHPMMPFVTEELWQAQFGEPGGMLIVADWPRADQPDDAEARAEIDWLIRTITAVRAARAEVNVPAGAVLNATLYEADATSLARLERQRPALLRLARLERVEPARGAIPQGALQVVVDEATLALPLTGVLDVGQEAKRLDKDLAKTEQESGKIRRKLDNEQFIAKAPPEVIEEQRVRLADYEQAAEKLRAARARLEALV